MGWGPSATRECSRGPASRRTLPPRQTPAAERATPRRAAGRYAPRAPMRCAPFVMRCAPMRSAAVSIPEGVANAKRSAGEGRRPGGGSPLPGGVLARALLLDIRTLFRHRTDIMAISDRYRQIGDITHFSKIYTYPCGVVDIIASSKPMFREDGWEDASWADSKRQPRPKAEAGAEQGPSEAKAEDMARSMRRARSRVRRLALSNDFKWFVTLTLDQQKVDRYDPVQVVRKLNQWASNQVKRKGLRYILVPERHKDGALHFHGFFNDALEAVPSGHTDKAGHMIYNFPGWSLGFTAGIAVYGDYAGAVAYVCKYIGKQGDKPAGRWYYSGGELREPDVLYGEIGPRELSAQYGDRVFQFTVPGAALAVVNGLRTDHPEPEGEGWEEIGLEVDSLG